MFLISTAALAVVLPRSAKADSSSPLDGVGKDNCSGCSRSQLLTTTQNDDVIIVVASGSNSTSVVDGSGLSFTQRLAYTYPVAGTGYHGMLVEYYAVASSPLNDDNITVNDASVSKPGMQVFAIHGANTGSIFDSAPSVPATVSCPSPDCGNCYADYNTNPGTCSASIETSSTDFVIATTAINDAADCGGSPQAPTGYQTPPGFTEVAASSSFEVDYMVSNNPPSNVAFDCYGTDAMAIALDAIAIAGPSSTVYTLSWQGYDWDGSGEETVTLNGQLLASLPTTYSPQNGGTWVAFSLNTTLLVQGTNTLTFTHANSDCPYIDQARDLVVSGQGGTVYSNMTVENINTASSCTNTLSYAFTVDAPWPGFHQNPQHTGLSPFNGPSTPALRWKFQTGGGITSSPAVAYGRIYVGSSDGNLYALNLEGILLWKFSTPSPIRTTPAVGSDGTIYVGSCLRCPYPDPSGGPEGVLYAINPNGTLKWNLTITNSGEGVDTLSSPTIGPDGTIYASDEGFRIVAVNPDGALKWQVWTHGEVVGPPAVAPDGTIYVQIDDPPPTGSCADTLNKCLVAVNPDGAIDWGLLDYGGFESPAVGTDGTIYIDSLAINSNGTFEWQDNQTFSSPSIGPDGTIYGTVDGGLFAVSPDGTVQWQFPLEKTGGFCTTPDCSQITRVFVQESSVAIGSDGTLYFGSGFTKYPGTSPSYGNGTVYAVDPDGTLAWTFTTGSCEPCSVNYALSDPAIGSEGTLYVGSSDGNLYAIGGS